MGLFSRKKTQAPAPEQNIAPDSAQRDVLAASLDVEHATVPKTAETSSAATPPVSTQPAAGEGLRALVKIMRAKAEGQVTLNLTQNGNDMKYTLYQRGQETESGLVTPDSEWFQAVADLYVEEEKSERGVWNRALIVVNPAIGSDAAVHASFMNTATSKTHNLNYALDMGASHAPQLSEAKQEQGAVPPITEQGEETAAQAEDRMSRISARLAQEKNTQSPVVPSVMVETKDEREEEAPDQPEEVHKSLLERIESADDSAQEDSAEAPERAEQEAAGPEAAQSATVTEPVPGEAANSESTVEETPILETAAEPADEESSADTLSQQGVVAAASAENYPATAKVQVSATREEAASEQADAHELPTHLDDSEFEAEEQHSAPASQASERQLPAPAPVLDAPMSGTSIDVAPSYAEHNQPKPSTTKKASGNLVLTEAEVVSRFAPTYEALFGPAGSARDVSTVLIRVRTLGSYYDALTHVRRNGFWEQVRTFDLVPEETLAILQLKADSYKEGYGSPLAINIRFTPGTPVEVSFDYADEEAFVRYPEHLPAQQYVEELRMFPRTGENIPAHMSEALASWTF